MTIPSPGKYLVLSNYRIRKTSSKKLGFVKARVLLDSGEVGKVKMITDRMQPASKAKNWISLGGMLTIHRPTIFHFSHIISNSYNEKKASSRLFVYKVLSYLEKYKIVVMLIINLTQKITCNNILKFCPDCFALF